MILYCEDCRCAVEAIPSLADREVLEGLTVEDEAHMGARVVQPELGGHRSEGL